jgi:hypothetical protein
MASRSRSIQDYDSITLKTIRAVNAPAYTTLTSDGVGGTYWSTLSSPMAYISAFKGICTPSKLYVADASYNIISFNAGKGIQFVPTGLYSTMLIANAFNEIAVPGLSTISSGQDRIAFSTVIFSSLGNTIFRTNPQLNKLTYEIRHPTFLIENTRLPLNDQNSTMTFIGQGDILLSTFSSTYFMGIQISTFTSTGYSALFSNLSTISTVVTSTISSLYTYKTQLSTAASIFKPSLESTFSTLHAQTNSTLLLSTLVNFSSVFSRYNLNIQNSVLSFSTAYGYNLTEGTSTTINQIFGNKIFYQNNQTSTVRNLIYDLQDMSTTMSSFIMPIYSTIKQNATTYWNLSTLIGGAILSTNSTIKNVSTYSLQLAGEQMSSFHISMKNRFSLLSSTGIRQDYKLPLTYTVNTGVNLTNGYQHDINLSTCELQLDSISSFIDYQSRIFIEYTPSYAFKTLSLTTISSISTSLTSAYVLSSFYSKNTYPVCTFISHYTYNSLRGSVYSDIMSFNVMNLPNTYMYQELYNRTIRVEIDPFTVLNSAFDTPNNRWYPYIIHHFHSSIVNLNNVDLFINDPQTNRLGGVVVPYTFTRDCDLNIYTTVQWSNSMNLSNAVTAYIHNGIYQGVL